MNKTDLKFITLSFIAWRLLLFIIAFFAISTFPLQQGFLGGNLEGYLNVPWFWGLINFDGEHYLSIAYQGYRSLTYFFFPVYPLLVKFISLNSSSVTRLATSGIFIANISFFIALVGFWKLIRLDFNRKIAKWSLVLLLIFPTSFFFGSFYTESVFLALVVWSLYLVRKRKWIESGILAAISSATRVVGMVMLPVLAIEVWLQRNRYKGKKLFKPTIGVLLVPMGLGVYMYFLNKQTGDPLEFFNSVGIFGEQRTAGFILLPQVFYRYIFKVLPSVNYSFLPISFVTVLEFVTAVWLVVVSIIAFFKLRLSWAVYLALAFLIPTLSGSFSSLPRYALVLFPAFLVTALYVSRLNKLGKAVILLILTFGLYLATSLFTRGYWVA